MRARGGRRCLPCAVAFPSAALVVNVALALWLELLLGRWRIIQFSSLPGLPLATACRLGERGISLDLNSVHLLYHPFFFPAGSQNFLPRPLYRTIHSGWMLPFLVVAWHVATIFYYFLRKHGIAFHVLFPTTRAADGTRVTPIVRACSFCVYSQQNCITRAVWFLARGLFPIS